MVSLAEALIVLFPASRPGIDWLVNKTNIVVWNLPQPQPTSEEIAAVTPEQVAQAVRSRADAQALMTGMTSPEIVYRVIRIIMDYTLTSLNDARELSGAARITREEHLQRLQTLIASGNAAGDPINLG